MTSGYVIVGLAWLTLGGALFCYLAHGLAPDHDFDGILSRKYEDEGK